MALHAGARSLLDASVGVSDMCLLEPLDEDNFIDNLRRRFMHNQIYVSTVRSDHSLPLAGPAPEVRSGNGISAIYAQTPPSQSHCGQGGCPGLKTETEPSFPLFKLFC